jgi:hypothetical protein
LSASSTLFLEVWWVEGRFVASRKVVRSRRDEEEGEGVWRRLEKGTMVSTRVAVTRLRRAEW